MQILYFRKSFLTIIGRFVPGYSDAYLNHYSNKFLRVRRTHEIIGYIVLMSS